MSEAKWRVAQCLRHFISDETRNILMNLVDSETRPLIEPYGGDLVNLLTTPEEEAELRRYGNSRRA